MAECRHADFQPLKSSAAGELHRRNRVDRLRPTKMTADLSQDQHRLSLPCRKRVDVVALVFRAKLILASVTAPYKLGSFCPVGGKILTVSILCQAVRISARERGLKIAIEGHAAHHSSMASPIRAIANAPISIKCMLIVWIESAGQ